MPFVSSRPLHALLERLGCRAKATDFMVINMMPQACRRACLIVLLTKGRLFFYALRLLSPSSCPLFWVERLGCRTKATGFMVINDATGL